MKFSIKDFFRNVAKNGHASCGFGHIYWRNP